MRGTSALQTSCLKKAAAPSFARRRREPIISQKQFTAAALDRRFALDKAQKPLAYPDDPLQSVEW